MMPPINISDAIPKCMVYFSADLMPLTCKLEALTETMTELLLLIIV